MISILILTLNEEVNVRVCLQSVDWSDDVVVLDSLSTDKSVEVAQAPGARVVQRKFDNWAAHLNWAMKEIRFKNPWVFYLDADEQVTPELRDEILAITRNAAETRVAFYCGRKNYFMNKWLKHAMPPGMIMRMFRPERIRFERPTPVIDGEHGRLKNHFLHSNFGNGIGEWLRKHNNYSQMEAAEGCKVMDGEFGSFLRSLKGSISKDKATRHEATKALSLFLPFRSFMRFFHAYLIKRGFLDGPAGFHYACLISMYEYWISLKVLETRSNWRRKTEKTVNKMLEEGQS